MATRANRGAVQYAALARALDKIDAPPCSGDDRFILEPHELAPDEVTHMGMTACRQCPVRDPCRTYGDTARPPTGVWAGRTYPPRTGRSREEQEDV